MKTFIAIVFLGAFAFPCLAQFSLEAALGTVLPTGNRFRLADPILTPPGTINISNTIRGLSFGPGIRVGITGFYQFPSGVGLGLEAHWFQSATARVEEVTTAEGVRFSDFSSTSYRLFPHLYYQLPTESKLEPFARMGVVFGFNTISEELFSDLNLTTLNISRSYRGSISFGYQMKVGGVYKLTEHWGIFSEIFLMAMVWSGEERVVNSAIQDGVDLLPTLTDAQINTPILETIIIDLDEPFDPFFPDQILRETIRYTTLGFSIGLRYRFGKQKAS
ncbi:MAG: hypothetical protein AAFV80_16615 [Bacteroidota bacterium]